MLKQNIIKAQQFDENFPIEFFMIEDNVDLFNFDYHYQCNFYQIYWFTQTNNSKQIVDFKSYDIYEDQIWIIYPGQIHNINPKGVKGYFVSVNKDCFNRIISQDFKYLLHPRLCFSLPNEKKTIFNALMILFKQELSNSNRTDVLEKYLSIYLTHIQDLEELYKANNFNDNRIIKLLDLVEQNYTKHYPNSFYADKIALSVKRMNEILSESTECTIKQHLNNRLMLEAKRLIGYSEFNIQEISSKLGFSEVNYFNRFFKKNSNITPSSFRDNVKKVQ